MREFERGLGRSVLWSALLTGLLLFCGCQTSTESLFVVGGPGWRLQQGQALWRPCQGMPELGGDLVFATHEDGRGFVEFAKTALPMVTAQTTHTNWLVRFPVNQMGFMGRRPLSTRFGWLYLQPALAGQPLPKTFRFQRKADGGWRLENTRSGEMMEGYLSP